MNQATNDHNQSEQSQNQHTHERKKKQMMAMILVGPYAIETGVRKLELCGVDKLCSEKTLTERSQIYVYSTSMFSISCCCMLVACELPLGHLETCQQQVKKDIQVVEMLWLLQNHQYHGPCVLYAYKYTYTQRHETDPVILKCNIMATRSQGHTQHVFTIHLLSSTDYSVN